MFAEERKAVGGDQGEGEEVEVEVKATTHTGP